MLRLAVFILCIVTAPLCAAQDWRVCGTAELIKALSSAAKGDTVTLEAGTYEGNFSVPSSIKVIGSADRASVIDAQGKGSALTVKASGTRIENLRIQNFGGDLYELNAGILVDENTSDVEIHNVSISGDGFGVRADRSKNITISGCEIRGNKRLHTLDRGDGVFLKYVDGAELHNNKVTYTRDGFYFEDTKHTRSSGNFFAALQYGIHFMYDKEDAAWNNRAVAVRGGYAIMNSEKVDVFNNRSSRTVEFGILMNVTDGSRVWGNKVEKAVNPRGKPELDTQGKALFIYGPGTNEVHDNEFALSDVGISVSMGGEGTAVWNNNILDNKLQVRYVGTGGLEWSRDGVGNYWSNYQGWDLDGNGVGDKPYQPNDSLDRLFWLYPEARFLMESPVVVLLRFLSNQFEVDRGKGITDSYPLMQPVTIGNPAADNKKEN